MPGFNVWAPRHSPFGNILSGVIHHAREVYQDRSSVYKRNRLGYDEIPDPGRPMDNPNKRARYSTRRRRPVKRRRVGRRRFRRARVSTLMPRTKLIRLNVVDQITHSTHTSGTIDVSVIQLNSCLDPMMTKGTGQPLGFDQWRALYEFGYVVGASITITAHNAETISMMVGVTPMNIAQGTTGLSNFEHYMELPGTKKMLLSPDVDHGVLQSRVSLKKWLRIKDFRDTNEYRMNLNTPSEPSKPVYWHLWTGPTNQTTTASTGVELVVQVSYIVLLTSPVVPSRSVA